MRRLRLGGRQQGCTAARCSCAARWLLAFPLVRAAQQETIPGSDSVIGNLLGADKPGPNLGKLNQHLMKNVLGPMEKNVDADRQALQDFLQSCP